MDDIDKLLQTIKKQMLDLDQFGQLQIHMKKHHGDFTNTDLVKITSIKFTDNEPNISATNAIFQMIKAIADTKETGTLTFNVSFKNGNADQLQVQDFKKI